MEDGKGRPAVREVSNIGQRIAVFSNKLRIIYEELGLPVPGEMYITGSVSRETGKKEYPGDIDLTVVVPMSLTESDRRSLEERIHEVGAENGVDFYFSTPEEGKLLSKGVDPLDFKNTSVRKESLKKTDFKKTGE